MRVALVHDYIKEYGGAERVLETLHEMYPQAPVYTLVYCPQFLGPHKERFANWDIRESWVGKVPFKHKFISIFRLLAPFVFPQFDLSGYDVVIVSATGAYCPNLIGTGEGVKGKSYHICYCHTPPRYLYGYATARQWKRNWLIRALAEIANHILRMVDFASAQHVDQFIANSQEVRARIQKFYRRDSIVIYPPVYSSSKRSESRSKILRQAQDDKKNSSRLRSNNNAYYLAGGRLARPKHFDVILKACSQLNTPLKIFGRGFAGYEAELHQILDTRHKIQEKSSNIKYPISNIELVGEVSDEEKLELMRGAKAFIFASEDEDFGIVPVEAMGVGTPVIAYKSGGVKESVVEGKTHSAGSGSATGVFFEELSVESLVGAIEKFESLHIKSEDCIKQAKRFSKENFEKGIRKLIKNH